MEREIGRIESRGRLAFHGGCVFLASHASDFVNGQILYADGGILAYIGRQPK